MKIQSITDLTNLVSDLATKQLVIAQAKAQAQAKVEAAKLAFDQATADLTSEINTGFEAITKFCEANKDTLFPVKKGKRQKTLQVLQHKLQYRSSTEVTAPSDIITRLHNRLADLTLQSRSITVPTDLDQIEAEIDLINSLIRLPEPEFNKEAASTHLNTESTALQLAPLGITKTENETFKLTFTLTPGE
jgi:phage host-nuclease inhibitor protein Gam